MAVPLEELLSQLTVLFYRRCPERLNEILKVSQLVNGRSRNRTMITCLPSQCPIVSDLLRFLASGSQKTCVTDIGKTHIIIKMHNDDYR